MKGINQNSIITVLDYYASATEHDPNWYKAWHAWAYMNFETVLFYKQQEKQGIGTEDESVARNAGLVSTTP